MTHASAASLAGPAPVAPLLPVDGPGVGSVEGRHPGTEPPPAGRVGRASDEDEILYPVSPPSISWPRLLPQL